MCSIITVKTQPFEFNHYFSSQLRDLEQIDERGINLRVHGYLKKERAPVVFLDSSGVLTIASKFFSLCPSWSRQWPFPFETYNARLTRPIKRSLLRDEAGLFHEVAQEREQPVQTEQLIYSVPSFRDAFKSGQTCLVPISAALESCYFGLSAGHIVRFSVLKESLFFALGLWNDWVDPMSGEIFPTFTLLTDEPDDFVKSHGHDRSIVVIDANNWEHWLRSSKLSMHQRFEWIRQKRIQPRWNVEVERALKSGWQKKAPTAEEIRQIKTWQPTLRKA